ncbi:MAG: hypothetical protein AAF604_07760 [Acidobacteriota bacterium]
MVRSTRLVSLVLVLVFALPLAAEELSQKSLQGSWLIVEFGGAPDSEGDRWEFEGNRFYQVISGRRIPPDEFTVVPGTIDLGYAKIEVKSFDGRTMEAVMAGFHYKLVKQ